MPAARRDSANARRTTRTSRRAGRWLTALASGVTCAAALGACGASGTTTTVTSVQGAGGTPPVAVTQASSANASAAQTTAASASYPARVSRSPSPTATATTAPAPPAASSGPLTGKSVGVDPGHNGGNFNDPSYIDQMIWNGREMEHCNTTGTETDSGYTEAQYNFNVASYLRADLQAEGATVVMTRHSNTGVGPCVNVRAHIIDASGADVAIDIHADGGPPDGRGFAILEPVADGINNRIIGASEQFGQILLHDFQRSPACRRAPTTGPAGSCSATTSPGSTSRPSPRC